MSMTFKRLVFPQDHGCSFGAAAGYPSITVPAAYSKEGEPFGITFSGKAYPEPELIGYAYAFEQHVKARANTLISFVEMTCGDASYDKLEGTE